MALSLVGDYGGSGSSSSSEEEESGDEMKRTETKSTKSQVCFCCLNVQLSESPPGDLSQV